MLFFACILVSGISATRELQQAPPVIVEPPPRVEESDGVAPSLFEPAQVSAASAVDLNLNKPVVGEIAMSVSGGAKSRAEQRAPLFPAPSIGWTLSLSVA